jgi:dCMP deaminase
LENKEMTDWDKTFMKIAYEFAEHSTCIRKQVGALITKNKRIIATGYNGSPHGIVHCKDKFKNIDFKELNTQGSPLNLKHHEFSEAFEVHAEANVIAFCAKYETVIGEDCTLYTTLSPCVNCAKLIAQTGIKRVVYSEKYDRNTDGIDLLKKMGIEVVQLNG